MRLFYILVIISLQALLGWLYFSDFSTCCKQKAEGPRLSDITQKPILFNWSSPTPITGETWQRFKDSLRLLVNAENKLEITAWYCIDEIGEVPPDSFGAGRLRAIRSLFPEIEDQNILGILREVRCDSLNKQVPFEAVSFYIREFSARVTATDDEITIYFPDNSTRLPEDGDVRAYLDKTAARVIATGEMLLVTGHTDYPGEPEKKSITGKKRAEGIRDYLISKGVSPTKIQVRSEGGEQATADNPIPEGQAENRRTTIQIIPSSK